MPRVRVGIVFLSLLIVSCSPVTETTLSNGLKVVIREDHRAPIVVSQIWYRVGAIDEPDGLTGVSHVLEHMMFKGTARHPSGEFSRVIAENGGRENAFTGSDYTAYFQQLEKSRLPVALELEADRMRNLTIDPAEFAKELRVVMEERRFRTDDQPAALAYEKFMNTAYTVHPYRNPVIGWMKDLESLSVEQVRAWYRRWYIPNNATLIVVGDVSPDEVIALVRQHFEKIPAGKLERTTIAAEPVQQAARRSTVRAPAKVPTLYLGFHVPAFTSRRDDWEPYALAVLAGVLDGGRSARFETRLVRHSQIAASVGAGYSPVSRGPVVFSVSATPSRGRSIADLEKAILAEIETTRNVAVSASELNRVKAQVAASNVFQRDSVFYQAMQMGMLETDGLGWSRMDEFADRIRSITAKQVQDVASKYMVRTNLTVTVLEPSSTSGRKAPAAPRGNLHAR